MSQELFLDKSGLDFEINAVKNAAEKIDTGVSIPVSIGNMPSFEKMLETYRALSLAVENCRSMSFTAAENIQKAAEAAARMDRSFKYHTYKG